MSDNPYAPPQEFEHSGENPLFVPAVFLLVLSIIYLLVLIASLPRQILQIRLIDTSTPEGQGQLVGQVMFLVMLFVAEIAVAMGAIAMLRLKGYRAAWTAAIFSMIPFCSPCFVLGIPFGVWAMVVLRNPATKDRFT